MNRRTAVLATFALPLFPDTPTALMAKLQRQHNTSAAQAGTPPLPVIRLHDLRPCSTSAAFV